MTDNLIVSHDAPFCFIKNPDHVRRKYMFKRKLAILALARHYLLVLQFLLLLMKPAKWQLKIAVRICLNGVR